MSTRPIHALTVIVKFLPCTNSRGSRVSLTRYSGNDWVSRKVYSYDHSSNGVHDQAVSVLQKAGCKILCSLEIPDAYVLAIDCGSVDNLDSILPFKS
jgi:hypothetical protein